MVEARNKLSSHWWWFESHNKATPNRSPWLQSTLAELDEKTKTMLKIIDQDADSFAQRAEMYYRKRPELINMVEDMYRTHRLLAERYDQVKTESGNRLLTQWASPLSSLTKGRAMKLSSFMDRAYDSYSETYEPEGSEGSEVDDPEPEEEEEEAYSTEDFQAEETISRGEKNEVVKLLTEEIERLSRENKTYKDLLLQKDEEKREVIRQLSLAFDLLRDENMSLRKSVSLDTPKKQNQTSAKDVNKLKEGFWTRLFKGSHM